MGYLDHTRKLIKKNQSSLVEAQRSKTNRKEDLRISILLVCLYFILFYLLIKMYKGPDSASSWKYFTKTSRRLSLVSRSLLVFVDFSGFM